MMWQMGNVAGIRKTLFGGFSLSLLGVGAMIAYSCAAKPALATDKITANLAQSPVEMHGRLQVKGNRILGKDGKPVSLAGMSLFWSQWIPQFYTEGTVAWLKKDWQASVVRAAIAAEHGGYITNPVTEMKHATSVIDAAIKEGMYVIVDWHDHNADQHTKQSVEFFTEIARKYGNQPNVIYEIFNEPQKQNWSKVIKPYSEEVIAAIRKHDPDNLIVVGNPTWSQDVDVAAADPIKDANVAYTLHFYAGTHKQYLRDKAKKALDMGVALFVTEWGTVEATGDGKIDRESTEAWMTFMRENQLSHCNWSVADKKEGAAILNPGASGTGNWKESDLTESGKYVRELVRGWTK